MFLCVRNLFPILKYINQQFFLISKDTAIYKTREDLDSTTWVQNLFVNKSFNIIFQILQCVNIFSVFFCITGLIFSKLYA